MTVKKNRPRDESVEIVLSELRGNDLVILPTH